MKKFIHNIIAKYIGDSSFKRNIFVMTIGRVISQVIPVLITPLLTRIYSPEEFGILGVYMAIVSFLAMLSNGRYTHAIVLPKEKEKAQNLVFFSSFLTIIFTLFVFFLLLFLQDQFFSVFNIEPIKKYFPILILNILFLGLYEPLFVYELRMKKYKKLATNVIIQSLALIIVRIVLGYLGYTDLGLILSYLVGYLVSFLLLVYKIDLKLNFSKLKEDTKSLMKKYINFPKFTLLSDSLVTLSTSLPNILLNSLFGSDSAGHFALSEKVLGSPIWFVTSSVGDVFRQEASELYRKGKDLRKLFVKTTKSMFKLGVIPFLLIFLFVPPLIPFILGEVWEPVGSYIRIFSIMYFSSFVVNPVSNMVYIIKKEKYGVLFQGLKLLSILVGLLLGFYYKNIELGLIIWSVLLTISNILIYGILYKIIDIKRIERQQED